MAKTETLTLRNVKASEISYTEALKLLRKKFPKAKVAKIEIDPELDNYTAHIIVAEFPPEGGDEAPEPKDEAPEGGEDGPPGLDGPPSPEDGGEEGGEKEEIHKLVALVEMMAEKMGIDPMMLGDDAGPPTGPEGMELPDVGAPSHMQPDKPLPPPAPKPSPMGGGGAAFAKRTVSVWREDDGVTKDEFLREAKEFFPGYRVAKVERHMGQGNNGYTGPVLLAALVRE